MNTIATYSFLPWLRAGHRQHDHGGRRRPDGQDPGEHPRRAAARRRSGRRRRRARPQPLPQNIALYGPGDIVGIDARAIVRTDPRPWITNFESNYLAAIDFYDEDFPWRYTPAAPDGTGLQLRPWIALIVLQESEFSEGQAALGPAAAVHHGHRRDRFPPADELWAWAHVHFNQSRRRRPEPSSSRPT